MRFALLIVLLASCAAGADDAPAFVPPAQTEAEVVADITAAARVLVAAVPAEDLGAATFAVGGPEQHYWHWIPAPLLADKTLGKSYAPYGRVGIPL